MFHYPLSQRTQWFLPALLALLLALIIGFVFIVKAVQSMALHPTGPSPAGEFGAAPTVVQPLTARNAYEQALPIAQAWRTDAELWRAEASWPTGSDLYQPPEAWTITFYSARRQEAANILSTAEGTRLLRIRNVSVAPNLEHIDGWLIDSPAAFEQLYASGGEAFLTVFPRRTLILTLHADEPLRWETTLINEGPLGNASVRQMTSLQFSAGDGRLITTPVEGDTNE